MDDADFECAGLLPGHSADVKHVSWHPTRDDVIASTSYDNSIRIWQEDIDSEEFLTVASLMGHGSTVWAASFNAKGTHLASVSADKSMIVWKNVSDGILQGSCSRWRAVTTLADIHSRPIYAVDWSSMDQPSDFIATGGGDNAVRVFQRKPSEELQDEDWKESFSMVAEVKQAHAGDVNCVRWHPSSPGLLATCGDDGRVNIWRVDEQT